MDEEYIIFLIAVITMRLTYSVGKPYEQGDVEIVVSTLKCLRLQQEYLSEEWFNGWNHLKGHLFTPVVLDIDYRLLIMRTPTCCLFMWPRLSPNMEVLRVIA